MSSHSKRTSYYRRVCRGERLTDIPIIDHHGHFEAFFDACREEETPQILSTMDAAAVDRGIIFTLREDDCRIANDVTICGVQEHPDRFLGYAFVKTDCPGGMVAELERCGRAGLIGLKLHSSYESDGFRQDAFREVWAFCAEHNWPVITHGFDPQLAYEHPDTTFIHAHGIEAFGRDAPMAAMRDCENYYWGTSATMTMMGAIEDAVEAFGADRLIFGSDYPGNNMVTRMGAVLAARISDEDMRKILGENVVRLLGLTLRDSFPM